MPSRIPSRIIVRPPSLRRAAGDVIGSTEDVVVVAAARAEETLLALAQALGRRAAGLDFVAAQVALRAEAGADGLA